MVMSPLTYTPTSATLLPNHPSSQVPSHRTSPWMKISRIKSIQLHQIQYVKKFSDSDTFYYFLNRLSIIMYTCFPYRIEMFEEIVFGVIFLSRDNFERLVRFLNPACTLFLVRTFSDNHQNAPIE
jgi:hypothetical protein